jgi:hypothetical protein
MGMVKIANVRITSALNGKKTAGCFHSVQHFSQLYFSA